ncbi:hypothetical protein AAF712_004371 [Marasmius tenuissimus]|uniref:F-box domain-containing protein n=1 Tax=Marasmius tenuissimus TaxID=585030 RepID=A0ABR3A3W2_9AGAR|nr:hypothetical protein PM082_003240 [Marasmius tenuissimus]
MSHHGQPNHRGRVFPRGHAQASRGRGTAITTAGAASQPPAPTSSTSGAAQSVATMDPGALLKRRAEQIVREEKRIKVTIEKYLGDWEPRPLSREEIDNIRAECVALASEAEKLVADRPKPPELNQSLEQTIWLKRLEYKIKYFRIFPINDLPIEIISNILRFVIWSAPNPTLGILWRLQITWVCKHWRHAAISDPTIWNAVWFRDAPPFTRSLAWVERAGSSQLDLRINDSEGRTYTDVDIKPLLVHLHPKLSNLRMLILLFENWEPILAILKWIEEAGRAGMEFNIERFELHRTGSPYIWPGMHFEPTGYGDALFTLFGGQRVPSLSYFTVNGVHLDWDKSVLENLTTLDLRRMPVTLCPSLHRFRQLLTLSPRLEKLSLDGAGPSGAPNPQHGLQPIECAHLKTLVIANFTVHYIHSIMSHFSAPNLKDLTFMNLFQGDYTPLYEYVTSRFPTVKLLTLYTIELIPSAINPFVRWLNSMPSLVYLRVAALPPSVLASFLYEPELLMRHPALKDQELASRMQIRADPAPGSPTANRRRQLPKPEDAKIICPSLRVIECQRMEESLLIDFGKARKMLGVPINKIYIPPEMAKSMSHATYTECKKFYSQINIIDIGAKTPEEEELLGS